MQQKAQTPIRLWRREGEGEETEMIKTERKGRERRGERGEGRERRGERKEREQ